MSYEKASRVISKYDLAVLTNQINRNSKYTIPGKFWEYLSCGLPIISNNRPSLEAYFKNYDIGWFLKNPREWNFFLRKIINGKEKLFKKKKNSLKLFNMTLENQISSNKE